MPVVASLIESGAIILGGTGFDFSKGKPFATFGIGALVGFGIREVIGWLGTVAKTMFPTDSRGGETTLESREAKRR